MDKTKLSDSEVVSKLIANLTQFQTDVVERNQYIDKRDRYLYGDGLMEEVSIPDGYDMTMYNYLRPITQIHATQLMQEEFGIYSYYDVDDQFVQDGKADDQQADEQKIAAQRLSNKAAEVKAWAKKDAIDAMIRDNGGHKIFVDGAQVGADYGSTLYQMWYEPKGKKIRIQLIESIQNWFPVWSDDNFRERVGDAYITQINPILAYQMYQDKVPEGGSFATSYSGEPLTTIQGTTTTLSASAGQTVSGSSTRRPMVTRIDYTGYLPNVCYEGGSFYSCKNGDETMISFKAVGNVIVQQITEQKLMPKFYYIPNSTVPRRPYGESDIPESALQLNGTIMQTKSNQLTRASKIIFPIIQAIGFENGSIPPRNNKEITIVPMQQGQEFRPVVFDTQSVEYERILKDLMGDLLQVTRVPRVLFDDPTVTLNSNQALLTSLRPMTDVVTKKQKNWEPVLTGMFDDALKLAAEYDPAMKQLMQDDTTYLYMRWPSALRKDDPAHQVMLLNDFHAGLISPQTYMESRGVRDVNEELNRIRAAMDDPYTAAMMGAQLGTLAHYRILEKEGIPSYGVNLPHITLRGDIAPQEVANMGHNYGWDQGPYGAGIGPVGHEGEKANEAWLNGAVQGLPAGGINPAAPQSGGAAQGPMATPGQNQPGAQPMSQPGSGATAVSPGGAIAQTNQRRGRR